MVSYLLALGLTFSFPLLFERFSVCLSFVYLETMFGSHRSWLARYIGPLLLLLIILTIALKALSLDCSNVDNTATADNSNNSIESLNSRL